MTRLAVMHAVGYVAPTSTEPCTILGPDLHFTVHAYTHWSARIHPPKHSARAHTPTQHAYIAYTRCICRTAFTDGATLGSAREGDHQPRGQLAIRIQGSQSRSGGSHQPRKGAPGAARRRRERRACHPVRVLCLVRCTGATVRPDPCTSELTPLFCSLLLLFSDPKTKKTARRMSGRTKSSSG